ncbi:hypothetical protein C8J57DRAFT_1283658 [Mycena rebaudengoi]|nr:hypothetical protein C8J57DRAFT_1283658 [Mycena rebaudengoi]
MWGYAVVVLTSELVLLLWIWVIFERNIRILAALGVLFIAELISLVVILARSFARLSITANIIPGFNFCSLINEPEFFFWYWLPVLTYNTVIFILFLVKGSQSFRSISHVNTLLHDVYRRSFLNFLASVFDSREDVSLIEINY